jgi:hypothetical protein
MPRTIAVGLVALLLASPVCAADRTDKSTLLSVDLARRVIVDATRKQDTPLLDANKFTIRRDETVVIEISQQNPLLFAYEAKNEKTDTEDYLAALAFGKQVKAFLDLFPAGQGGGIILKRVRGLEPNEFQTDLKTLTGLIEGLPAALGESLGTAEQAAALKKTYALATITVLATRLDADFNAMEQIATACLTGNGDLKTDSGEAITCDGPALINENIALAAATATARAAADNVKRIVAQLADATSRKTEAERKKDKGAAEIAKEIVALQAEKTIADKKAAEADDDVRGRRAARSARPTLVEFVQLALPLDERVHQHLATLRGFAADVALLQTPLTLITAPYTIQRQTITVQVTSSGKYEALLDASTRKKRDAALRKFTIVLDPYQPAHLSVAPAFVIGFVRNPEFSAVKKGDAYVIQQNDPDLTRYTLGAMLNITPDAWQEPTFGGHFQIGITPTKNEFGFYFGAGLRAQRLFTFGGGLMIQQVRRLSGGLTLDSKLADPSDLKTDTHFAQGLYLHFTVELPK